MRRFILAVLAVALTLVASPLRSQTTSPLEAIGFMSGCWTGSADEATTIEETYTSAQGDLVLGMTRYHQAGRVVMFEFTTIASDSAGIVMTPRPRGKGDVPFRMVALESGRAVFENLEHDFPQRIVYQRLDADTLVARIGGGNRAEEWRMTPCASGP